VKADEQTDNARSDAAVEKRIRQLENDLAAQRQEVRQLNADAKQWKQRAVAAEQAARHPAPAYPAPQPANYVASSPEASAYPMPYQSPSTYQQSYGFASGPPSENFPSYQTASPPTSFRGGTVATIVAVLDVVRPASPDVARVSCAQSLAITRHSAQTVEPRHLYRGTVMFRRMHPLLHIRKLILMLNINVPLRRERQFFLSTGL